jgi:cytidylate kinase
VIESRLAGWIVRHEYLEAVATWIDSDPQVRAERVAGREGVAVAQALADNAQRQRVERQRYLSLYGIDVADLSIYDLVLDSVALAPEELADRIVATARKRFAVT